VARAVEEPVSISLLAPYVDAAGGLVEMSTWVSAVEPLADHTGCFFCWLPSGRLVR